MQKRKYIKKLWPYLNCRRRRKCCVRTNDLACKRCKEMHKECSWPKMFCITSSHNLTCASEADREKLYSLGTAETKKGTAMDILPGRKNYTACGRV